MSPIDAARAIYDKEPCRNSFETDLFWHLRNGIVLSTPECFAMVRPVWHDWPPDMLKNPFWAEPNGDCWMMWLAAGDITPVFGLGPPREYCCYEIDNVLRVMQYDAFRRLYRPRSLWVTAEEEKTPRRSICELPQGIPEHEPSVLSEMVQN